LREERGALGRRNRREDRHHARATGSGKFQNFEQYPLGDANAVIEGCPAHHRAVALVVQEDIGLAVPGRDALHVQLAVHAVFLGSSVAFGRVVTTCGSKVGSAATSGGGGGSSSGVVPDGRGRALDWAAAGKAVEAATAAITSRNDVRMGALFGTRSVAG
jgi:hypothetical protein